jgi:hypothetical protein
MRSTSMLAERWSSLRSVVLAAAALVVMLAAVQPPRPRHPHRHSSGAERLLVHKCRR